jgi:hypothetical protein
VTPPYLYNGETFETEHELVVRFLDDLRAAEGFGAEVLALWAGVAREPSVRGGLQTICARERAHAELLARRLETLGGSCTADLSDGLKVAARERFASPEISDVEKLRDFVVRHPDVEAGVKPIRDVISQLADDLETKALLATILDDEIASMRWMLGTFKALSAARDPVVS